MKYYIIAGEASGDLLGSYLMAEIKRNDPEADFLVWGGDLMEAQGGEVIKHYKDLAFMGFWEVLVNLRTILKNFSICKVDMLLYEPDVVIFIDYPGFNLKMAKFARENGFKVVHYASFRVGMEEKKEYFRSKEMSTYCFPFCLSKKSFMHAINTMLPTLDILCWMLFRIKRLKWFPWLISNSSINWMSAPSLP